MLSTLRSHFTKGSLNREIWQIFTLSDTFLFWAFLCKLDTGYGPIQDVDNFGRISRFPIALSFQPSIQKEFSFCFHLVGLVNYILFSRWIWFQFALKAILWIISPPNPNWYYVAWCICMMRASYSPCSTIKKITIFFETFIYQVEWSEHILFCCGFTWRLHLLMDCDVLFARLYCHSCHIFVWSHVWTCPQYIKLRNWMGCQPCAMKQIQYNIGQPFCGFVSASRECVFFIVSL
jgi:hypothetical protein